MRIFQTILLLSNRTEEDTVGMNERHEGLCPQVRHINMKMKKKKMVGVPALLP